MPDPRSALWSARDALTLIVEDELQPYDRRDGRYVTKDMHLHQLPWPVDALQALGQARVEMRVTLSYFVEPSPGRRGWKYRHRYASHRLRFDVKTNEESLAEFRYRLNAQARREEEGEVTTASDAHEWMVGPTLRHAGSLHHDRWSGTAEALSKRQFIGIYPVIGWWRERPHLERWSRGARYSLVVSIRTLEIEADIYTPVAVQLGVPVVTGT